MCPLYVDRYHYTARLAEMVAGCIGRRMINEELIPSAWAPGQRQSLDRGAIGDP